jgi:hypothetical protein
MLHTVRNLVVGIEIVTLLAVTALVFVMFDRGSHSVSDTLRPFLITMAPFCIVAFWGARTLTNERH